MIRAAFLALAAFIVVGCAGPAEPVWAPDKAVEGARYAHEGPAKLTLYTVIATRNGSGAHSAIMVNADERVLFDPAGTFNVPFIPERNDVLFGMTPRAVSAYIDYHARPSHDVLIQEVTISPEQARRIATLIKTHGAVPKAQCALSIGGILQQVQGFEDVPRSYFPKTLQQAFAKRPGVETRRITDATADTSHNVRFVERAF